MDILLFEVRYFVHKDRAKIAKTAYLFNALLNINSGTITIGEYTFFGQNVSIITGTHDHTLLGKDRMHNFPHEGNNIEIGNGVWIGSNATVLGPCVIGDNAVIAAGAIVTKNVEANTIVAGVPAVVIKLIE